MRTGWGVSDTPWGELFSFHYTLDWPAVRARYGASVSGSLTSFLIAVAVFWTAERIRRAMIVARRPVEHVLVGALVMILAGSVLGVVCSVTLEIALSEPTRIDPVATVGVGLLLGVGT